MYCKRFLAMVLVVACTNALGQSCKVLDPELQSYYFGRCVDGLAEGPGRAGGIAEYEGGFKAGRKHGPGVKRWPNGDRYEGDFVADLKEGRGTYVWGRGQWQGERYEGEYANDKREGQGTYSWPTGDVYRGPWVADRIAGFATPMMLAQRTHAEEALKALSRKGQKVCREMPLGIALSEWIHGEIAGVSGGRVAVRVTQPGQNGSIGGAMLQAGDVVWDRPTAWTPCW